jgi:hypothetical protein
LLLRISRGVRLWPDLSADFSHDEWNPQRRFVCEEAMRLLAMVAERLAMVASDYDERRLARCAYLI